MLTCFLLSCTVRAMVKGIHPSKESCVVVGRCHSSGSKFFTYERTDCKLVDHHTAMKILHKFEKDRDMKKQAHMQGITKTLFKQSMKKFKQSYQNNTKMSSLQIQHVLNGIANKQYPLNALLPFFLDHSNMLYPAVKPHQKMKEISDLSEPSLWYPNARLIRREITFHAGPTNSGKTHAALERFLEVESAVYCSPLRLLAREVCNKSRERGVSCDMITGDDRDYHHGHQSVPVNKLACTVEMTDLSKNYDVAIIDEIQMISDVERGWAWSRALLGVCAKEIHVCGEERALNMISLLAAECGDEMNMVKYKRLGQLRVKKQPVESLEKLRAGDCIVCFSRDQLFNYKERLAQEGMEAAIIYGNLPPQTKAEEAKKFNDPDHPCNILLTTDAIGMGLNLNIKRIIFNDVKKTMITARGDRRVLPLSSSQALQISGRAGRYGSQYPDGAVTAMHPQHQSILLRLLNEKSTKIKRAGILPSFERLESFAGLMKAKSLHDVLSVFVSMCETDKKLYFLCSLKDRQEIAESLSNISMSLSDMYTFCLSPVSCNRDSVMRILHVFATFFANGLQITEDDVKFMLCWPPVRARTKQEIGVLEDVHECLRLYLWLSYRFPSTFPHRRKIREMRKTVDRLTLQSVSHNSMQSFDKLFMK